MRCSHMAPAARLVGVADTTSPAGPFAVSRPYTVVFLTTDAGALPLALRDAVSV